MLRQQKIRNAYPLGTDVVCLAKNVQSFGVFVRLKDDPGTTGFIRPSEWSWAHSIFDPAREVSVGDQLTARVIGYRESDLQLSRRRAIPDPYPEFRTHHRMGDVVLGQLEFIAHRGAGAQISLPGGIEGFIPRSEFPDFAVQREGFGLLAQDWIAATILRFEDAEVILSVKEHLRMRERARGVREAADRRTLRYHPTLGVTLEDLGLTLQIREFQEPEIGAGLRDRIRKILVVEDNAEVSDSLEIVFTHFGFLCDHAFSVKEARQRLAELAYDVLILDINLPDSKGFDLIRQAPKAMPSYVFVLTAAAAHDWVRLLEDTRLVTAFLQKPVSITRIFESLERQLAGQIPIEDDRGQPVGLRGEAIESELSRRSKTISRGARQAQIDAHLKRLQQETGASQAFVLSYRSGPSFEVIAGRFVELTREAQQNLDFSPIGASIRNRRFIHAADTSQRRRQFRHLLEVSPVQSFAGLPLDYSDEAEYGLFVLGESRDQLRNVTEEGLRQAGALIGRLLAEDRLDAMIMENQGLLLTGFLADSLLHEVKNEVQALDNFAGLQGQLVKKHLADLGAMSATENLELKRAIVGIQQVSERLNELILLFRNLAGSVHREEVDLNLALQRLERTLRPLAEERNVVIETELSEEMPQLYLSRKFLDQPLLNIMINAIEQMAAFEVPYRLLRIATLYAPESEFPVRISIADTGPGIHFIHQKRIFDLFFTTKEHGTGLGLYIARFFIERLGGRLLLDYSYRLSGTQFSVELPREILAP